MKPGTEQLVWSFWVTLFLLTPYAFPRTHAPMLRDVYCFIALLLDSNTCE